VDAQDEAPWSVEYGPILHMMEAESRVR
jgi:hypothetical protein